MTPIPLSDQRVSDLRTLYDRCYGCGSQNPIGLHLDGFTEIPNGVRAPFDPKQDFNGFHGILHGGVIATALDEISAWAAIHTDGVFIFTAKLEIRYRSEARIDELFVLEGVVEERRGKRLLIKASLTGPDAVVAESSGLFVVADTVENLLARKGDITST